MTKQLRGPEFDRALDALLDDWEQKLPSERRINVKAVAEALGVSRTSLHRESDPSLGYPPELRSRRSRVRDASRRQAEKAGLSAEPSTLERFCERLRRVAEERDEWRARCEALQLTIAGMEYWANVYGWDASKLRESLPPNDRAGRTRTTSIPARSHSSRARR